jgi:hypothetical protein
LITLDVCGIDRDLSVRVRDAIDARHHLGRAQVVLACSHTHSGPVTGRNLVTMYPLSEQEHRLVGDYTGFLEKAVTELAGKACAGFKPSGRQPGVRLRARAHRGLARRRARRRGRRRQHSGNHDDQRREHAKHCG